MNDQGLNQQDSQVTSNGVSFPTVDESPRKVKGAKTLLIAGILVLIGILGFVIFKSASKKSDTISIEPSVEDTFTEPIAQTPTPTSTSTLSVLATPKASSKTGVTIEVQNGTGITGEAAYLQTQLKNLGYEKISVGNAGSQNATVTNVTFSKSLSGDIVDEITKKLQSLYQEVSVKTSSTQTSDIIIVTGLRKGATTKPTATSTPKSSSTPTASPRASSTPTSTP